MKALAEEANPPASHAMTNLQVEPKQTVMRSLFWDEREAPRGLAPRQPSSAFQSNLLAKSQVWNDSSHLTAARWPTSTKKKKGGDEHVGEKKKKKSIPFWSCLVAEGDGSQGEDWFSTAGSLVNALFQRVVVLGLVTSAEGSGGWDVHIHYSNYMFSARSENQIFKLDLWHHK